MENYDKTNKQGLAVDIDETLSWTIGYWVEQMQNKFGNPENLSVKEMVEKYRYTQNIPYWQTDEALDWMRNSIHSNELQKELPLIEEADIYLNKINEVIPIVAYITVRPQSVLTGTQDWLKKNGFPEAQIICKPIDIEHENGSKWKAEILEKLYPNVLGIIDDNIKLLEFLNTNYSGIIFAYDHASIDNKNGINVIPCKNWPNVYEEVKKYFNK